MLSHFLRDIAYAFGFDDANGESPQPSDIFRARSSSYPAAVLVIVPIDNVMAAVFDAPVATVGGKYALKVGLIRRTADNAIGGVTGIFTGFSVFKVLSIMNPLKIANGVYDVGIIDWNIRDFYGYSTDRGTSYNAFLIIDDKVILIDTVKMVEGHRLQYVPDQAGIEACVEYGKMIGETVSVGIN